CRSVPESAQMSTTIREAWLVRDGQRSKIVWARDSLWICRMNQSGRKNHGSSNYALPPPFPAVHARKCDGKGTPRRRCLEYSRSCESSSGIHDRFTLEKPIGIH